MASGGGPISASEAETSMGVTMSKTYKPIAVAFGVFAMTAPAPAADLGGSPRVQVAAPDYYEAPAYNWSGLYFGGFVGGAHGVWTVDFFRNNNHGHAEEGQDGFEGGGYAGYNVQMSRNWVIGIEGDLGASNAEEKNDVFDNDTSLARIDTFGSIRGRLGYVYDRMMVFGTAGVAFGSITNDIQKGRNAGEQIVLENDWQAGLAVGAGLEYAFTNNWIGRAEYQYANFGTTTLLNRDGNRAEMENELHQLRIGMAYKF